MPETESSKEVRASSLNLIANGVPKTTLRLAYCTHWTPCQLFLRQVSHLGAFLHDAGSVQALSEARLTG